MEVQRPPKPNRLPRLTLGAALLPRLHDHRGVQHEGHRSIALHETRSVNRHSNLELAQHKLLAHQPVLEGTVLPGVVLVQRRADHGNRRAARIQSTLVRQTTNDHALNATTCSASALASARARSVALREPTIATLRVRRMSRSSPEKYGSEGSFVCSKRLSEPSKLSVVTLRNTVPPAPC